MQPDTQTPVQHPAPGVLYAFVGFALAFELLAFALLGLAV